MKRFHCPDHRPPAGVRTRHRSARLAQGVSLVEALVALAVMGIGILGVVGMQSTLRQNGDLSRQRAEAVRLASEDIEAARGFASLGSTAQSDGFADIGLPATSVVTAAQQANANTAYTIRRTVPVIGAEGTRTLVADVEWADRTGEAQRIRLATTIAAVAPELAGSVSIPAQTGALQRPLGRNPAIPVGAVMQTGGSTSVFTPPNTTDVTWTFNNVTGEITRICDPTCVDVRRFLLSGFVRFATVAAPTPADAEFPPGNAFAARIEVLLNNPSAGTVVSCTNSLPNAGTVSYFCAVPVTTVQPFRWSGRSRVADSSIPGGSALSVNLGDTATNNFKVCRYTTESASRPPPIPNREHPLDYVDVNGPLTNQNFLIIRAGDGSSPFVCPADTDPARNTFRHQPSA